MNSAETFGPNRPLLFAIAYRMLGSVMDAEDMVQETFLRWQSAVNVRSPKSYLSTIVTRLCIDHLRSARVQRDEYVGPWLPEPLFTEETPDLDEKLTQADSLSMAFLVILESLQPAERAAFLLREVFDYEYAEIATIVDKSEANCRQMVHRARRHVRDRRPRFDAPPEQVLRLTEQFMQASTSGDMSGLLRLLSEEVTLLSDGGGKTVAALNPILGQDNVARFLVGIAGQAPDDFEYRFAQINGRPGVVNYVDGRPQSVATLEIVDGEISSIYIIVNPDKLQRVPPLRPSAEGLHAAAGDPSQD